MRKAIKILKNMAVAEHLSEREKYAVNLILSDKQCFLPGWDFNFIKQLGDIKTIVDIGVLDGTPELYAAYPDAYLVLIEALPPFEDACRRILESRKGEHHICAAGDEDGETVIRMAKHSPGISSILPLSHRREIEGEFAIPMVRLDTLLKGRTFDDGVLLKIDTEGMELKIVQGATEFLKSVKYVIAETAIRHRHPGSYRFSELAGFLHQNGFEVYDFIRVTRSKQGMPGADIADTIFVNTKI